MTIQIYLTGGLGNQMFQYAAALSLAKKHSHELVINTSEFENDALRDYALSPYLKDSQNKIINASCSPRKKYIDKILSACGAPLYFEPHYHYDSNFFKKPWKKIYGYFQSDKYFEDSKQAIISTFTLSQTDLSDKARKYLEQIEKANNSVSIHVRLGDYLTNKTHNATHGILSPSYYKKAITLLQNKYGDSLQIFMFSDEPEKSKEILNLSKSKNVNIVKGFAKSPEIDIFLMSQCQHNIIANSSFSWWGAYLNTFQDKTVIAPRQWFSDEVLRVRNICDLLPKSWITI